MTGSPERRPWVPHDLPHPIGGAEAGVLAGMTVAVKDCYDIVGERTGIGSPDWLADAAPATATAAAVQRVLEAGATVVGKTICDEFLYSVTGANVHYGTPPNPHAPGRLPGGSSSGSASAVAAGDCDFALGTDTGGSIRVPAALCGLYGLRTTRGRVAMDGIQAMAPSFDSAGWLATTPDVLQRVGSVLLEGEPVSAQVERVLVATDLLDEAEAVCREALALFLDRAATVLPPAQPTVLAAEGIALWSETFRTIQAFETWQTFGGWITAHHPHLGPGIDERMAYAATVSAADAKAARQQHARVSDGLRKALPPGTVVVLPTAPCPAPSLEASAPEVQEFRRRSLLLTCPAGLGGLPQVSIPSGSDDGVPVAVSLLGWPGGDEVLLDVARRLSRSAASGTKVQSATAV